MCGIVAYAGKSAEGTWRETHRIVEALLINSQQRGRDSTGFVAMTEPFKNRIDQQIVADKAPLAAADFVRRSSRWRGLRHRRSSAVVAHVRWATSGTPANNANNHPFCGNRFSLVHNGVIGGHRQIAAESGLQLESDCDSELLLRIVEFADDPILGLRAALDELKGGMGAVALLDAHTGLIWLARDADRPLWAAQIDRRTFIASTREILAESFRGALGASWQRRVDLLLPLGAGHPIALGFSGELLAPDSRGGDG